jgi:conjugative relaxase-like TrwC/TraI family protein
LAVGVSEWARCLAPDLRMRQGRPVLRIYQSKSVGEAKRYYTQALSREDYYTQGREIIGGWGGRAAERLGLGGDVDQARFARLCENRHPDTSDKLTPRTRDDRTVGYDFNFHAPKGISVLQALTGDTRITQAMRDAVQETMREIERATQTRVRLPGEDGRPRSEDRTTGNLVWGEFVHFTARPVDGVPDPHLHVHCFVQNATFDEVEDRWKAANFRAIIRDHPYYQAAFHSRLAMNLERLGYAVERRREGWDLAGIERATVEKFSNRTQEIEATAKKLGIIDPTLKAELGAKTRKSKDVPLTDQQLSKNWFDRLDEGEQERLNRVIQSAAEHRERGSAPREQAVSAREALDYAVAHVFERASVQSAPRLVAEVLRHGLGDVRPDEAWKALDSHPELMSGEIDGLRHLTTRTVVEEERAVLRYAVDGKGVERPLGENPGDQERRGYQIGSVAQREGFELTAAQREAVAQVLSSQNRVQIVRGGAGTGKTTLLKEAAAGIRHGGKQVVAVAITTDASRGVLREAGFDKAETLEKFLTTPKLRDAARGQVLWVDEAGMVGTPTMRRLFEAAEKIDARVVLAGDTKQHAPVERGDALGLLERRAGITPAEVNTIVRQKGLYRQAVEALTKGELVKSVTLLDRMGAIKEISNEERHEAIAERYAAAVKRDKSALVVSPTHAEGKAVTATIRDKLRDQGRIAQEDVPLTRLSDLQWTHAQKTDPVNYEVGQVIQFTQHCPGVPRRGIPPAPAGLKARVVGCDPAKGLVTVEDAAKRLRPLPLSKADRFQVFREEQLGLAIGDVVRVTKNGRTLDGRHSVRNGSHYKVAGFTREGHIRLDNKGGWVVSKHFGHLNHGYCTTPQAAQGKSVDVCLAAMGSASMSASTLEQLYVVVSRGKERAELFTDHRKSLIEAFSRVAKQRSGVEMLENTPPPTPR